MTEEGLEQAKETKEEGDDAPLIVGVGASAGGLEALNQFLAPIKAVHNLTVIVAQHLAPQHHSLLSDLLSRSAGIPVTEVTNGMAFEAGHVYVTPPNHDIGVHDGRMVLTPPHMIRGPKPSVDLFFESLAEEIGHNCVGVILSGTGSDGSRGVKAIKAANGAVIVQTPESAKYDGMPGAAIRTGSADLILEPGDMVDAILRLKGEKGLVKDPNPDEALLEDILSTVHRFTDVNFHHYKTATIFRRIEARMSANRIRSLSEYVDFITDNSEEAIKLQRDILICVTEFFRDFEAFNELRTALEAQIENAGPDHKPYRVWVPGCATGEEAYSLAMLLADIDTTRKIQIFATDLDDFALEEARRGIYSQAAIKDLPDELVDRHFEDTGYGFEVKRQIRDMVVFARHNVAQDPPFLHLNLVSCRNLLIYFRTDLQRKVLQRFHQCLDKHGLLFLGRSENIGMDPPQLFFEINRKARVFEVQSNIPPVIHSTADYIPSTRQKYKQPPPKPAVREHDEVKESLIDLFVPPAALVDRNSVVIRSFGNVRRYLSIGPGTPDYSILALVPEPLRLSLRTLLFRATKEDGPMKGQETLVDLHGEEKMLRTDVRVFGSDSVREYLVTFHESDPDSEETKPSGRSTEEVTALEAELKSVKVHLQTVVEELESSNEELQSLNEELQSSNEELQASNEELQASNEEMESSNEELQSTNEELLTVNAELEQKSIDLSNTLADIENIQNSGGDPILVVDLDLKIRRTNEWMNTIFGISREVHGLHLEKLDLKVGLSDLAFRVRTVMATEVPLEREVVQAGKHYKLKVSPFYTSDAIEGAVLIFQDISELTATSSALAASEKQFRDLIEGSNQGVLIRKGQEVMFANEALTGIFGLQLETDIHGLGNCLELFRTANGEISLNEEFINSNRSVSTQTTCMSMDQRLITLLVNQRPVNWAGQDCLQMVIQDVTEQVMAETHLRNAQRIELLGRLTGGVAHDFNNLMAIVQGYAELISLNSNGTDSNATNILDAVKRGKQLVSKLLTYARKQKLKPVKTEINQWLRNEAPLLQRALGTEFYIDLDLVDEELHCMVDLGELETSILNLLINARDAMTDTGGTIRIETFLDTVQPGAVTDEALTTGRYIRVSVIDTGHGMSKEVQAKAFEPFFTTKPIGEGSGLGLSSVYGFARQSGGDARIESSSSFGTRISLWLPFCDQTDEPEAEQGHDAENTQDVDTGALSGTILIVDDNSALQLMIKELCHHLKLDTFTANSGKQALSILAESNVDLMLTDVSLAASISGLELAAKARQLKPKIKIVLMSGQQIKPKAVTESGYEYIQKPFGLKELSQLLTKVLGE